MFELLYTSAPAGLKPGSSGFATVAATRGIPRPLMDRLEALSIYRHTPDSALTAQAHWLLNVGGKEYHVLSRIADAGLDHTQRTNFLAHHLAFDHDSLPPAGPAWLLSRGVLDSRWDGIVGERSPRPALPTGDDPAARCTAWADLTGDPGWAGVIAESITKNPRRPIGIIFSPGTSILPLIREALALLPPHQRWAATFNTYYTSMPTSATCAWRCCLADTPAAADLRRYAAAGLLIDLTRPDALPALPPTPWTIAARDGIAPQDPTAPRAATAIAVPPRQSPPTLAAILNAAPADPLALAGPSHSAADDSIMISRGKAPKRPTKLPTGAIPPPANAPKPKADTRRARQLILLYSIACLAIGAGTWLLVAAYNNSNAAPPEITTPSLDKTAVDLARRNANTPNLGLTPPPDTAPALNPNTPAPNNQIPSTPAPESVAVAPTPTPPPPPRLPKNVTLHRPLVARTLTGGLSDITQSFTLDPDDFTNLRATQSLSLQFPNDKPLFPLNTSNLHGLYKLRATPGTAALAIVWDDDAARAAVEVAHLAVANDQLTVVWRHRIILNRPDVYTTLYWLLGRSTITLADDTNAAPDTIRFPARETQPINPTDPASVLTYSMALPPVTQLAPHVPDDWKATILPPPAPNATAPAPIDSPDTAALPDGPAITFQRPGLIPATFTLTFSKDLTHVTSDLPIQIKALQQQQSDVADQQTAAQTALDQLAAGPQQQLDAITPQLTLLHQQLDQSDEDLDKKNLKRTDLLQTQAQLQEQAAQLRATLDSTTKDARANLAAIQAKSAAIAAALSYDEKRPDLSIDFVLPGNVPIATATLSQEAPK